VQEIEGGVYPLKSLSRRLDICGISDSDLDLIDPWLASDLLEISDVDPYMGFLGDQKTNKATTHIA
jgi:hypothetical protein